MSRAPNYTTEKGLPANVDAEKTILGAILLDNDALNEMRRSLKPDDFSLDSHRRIALRMSELEKAGNTIDIVTLSNLLGKYKEIEAIGGVAYLASLTEGLPRRPVIADYLRIVKDKSMLRRLMDICSQAIARAADQSEEALQILGSVQTNVEKIASGVQEENGGPVANFAVAVLDRINAEYQNKTAPCIPTGNSWIDARTGGGYRMGKYTIVAARPKVGKSAWASMSIAHNCQRGTKVVDFSLEMEKDEILKNLVPYVVEIPNVTVNRPATQTPEQNLAVNRAIADIVERWPLSIYDGDMDIDRVCWTMDHETRHGESVLFVLDHFGLLQGQGKTIRERYVENSSRLRRKIAQKKNCALLNLFQLNPVPREFADKRPLPEDLKESKNPLEDAFACVLLHRYIDKETLRMTKKANINLALVRSGGAPGNVDCDFNLRKLLFEAPAEIDYADDDSFFA